MIFIHYNKSNYLQTYLTNNLHKIILFFSQSNWKVSLNKY